MKKMICPNCGEVGMYGQKELVERTLLFNAEGCVGSTDGQIRTCRTIGIIT